jgi:hypothetical protein
VTGKKTTERSSPETVLDLRDRCWAARREFLDGLSLSGLQALRWASLLLYPFFSEFFSSSFLVEIILGKEKIKEREGLQRSNHI